MNFRNNDYANQAYSNYAWSVFYVLVAVILSIQDFTDPTPLEDNFEVVHSIATFVMIAIVVFFVPQCLILASRLMHQAHRDDDEYGLEKDEDDDEDEDIEEDELM